MKRLLMITAAALATLMPAVALSMTWASRETVSVYDDWTAIVLQEGDLRVCYAETKLIPPAKATQGLGDMRLQVTSRSLGDGSTMVQLTKDPDSFDMEISVKIGSTLALPLKRLVNPMRSFFAGDVADFYAKLVEDMKAGEAAKVEMALTRDTDGAAVGAYSLRGFSDAYGQASKICSPSRYGDRYKDPVTVSGISAEVNPSVYSEFSFTGPFFGRSNKVTVRAVPDDPEDPNIAGYMAPELVPSGIFTYGAQRLEFYRDQELVDVYPGHYRTEILGVCYDPETIRLRLLLNFWSGSATIPGQDRVVYFDRNAGTIVGESVSMVEGTPTMVDCSDDESSWEWDASFFPCVCAGRATNSEYRPRLAEIVREISRLSERSSGASLYNLFFDIARLEPWVRWDAGTDLDVQRFESSKFEVVVITHEDHLDVYNSDQITFVRRRADDYFVPVHKAGVSSKAFNTLTIHGFVHDEVLDVTMCVDDCNWWGRHERVTKNVGDWWREGKR